jgi:hypothetical protein
MSVGSAAANLGRTEKQANFEGAVQKTASGCLCGDQNWLLQPS